MNFEGWAVNCDFITTENSKQSSKQIGWMSKIYSPYQAGLTEDLHARQLGFIRMRWANCLRIKIVKRRVCPFGRSKGNSGKGEAT